MLKQALAGVLAPDEISNLYSAFDMIGEIVIIKIPDPLLAKKDLIGKAILDNVHNAKSVFVQSSAVRGDYRIRDLELIAGIDSTVTEYKEHGCRFKVDVARTYFSPRLSTERERIAKMVRDGEVVVNMFAGVGTYSIVIAKAVNECLVYSIDSNKIAADLCEQNILLNKVGGKVISVHADATEVIQNSLGGQADRVLMPLPERAFEFVDSAVSALKAEQTGVVHYFAHVKSNNKKGAKESGMVESRKAFEKYNIEIADLRVVREVGPRIYQIVADVLVRR